MDWVQIYTCGFVLFHLWSYVRAEVGPTAVCFTLLLLLVPCLRVWGLL